MKLHGIMTQMASALTAVNTSNLAIYVYHVPAGAPKLQGVCALFTREKVHRFSNMSHLKILGATIQSLITMVTWCLGFMHPHSIDTEIILYTFYFPHYTFKL
jgi:hypothetical protein